MTNLTALPLILAVKTGCSWNVSVVSLKLKLARALFAMFVPAVSLAEYARSIITVGRRLWFCEEKGFHKVLNLRLWFGLS